MATKKAAAKSPKSKSSKPLKPISSIVKKRSIVVPIIAIVLIAITAVAVYFAVQQSPEGTVLVTVNGEPIYEEQIAAEYARIPVQYQEQITHEYLLNQTIDKVLLVQEARERGITVDEADVDAQLEQIRAQFSITDEQLIELLSTQNMTVEEYRTLVREELLLAQVIDEAVLRRVTVTDQEVISEYENNEAEFTAPPGAAVFRHILVENETIAEQIIEQLDDGESFAELAQEHSLDSSAAQGGYLGILGNDSLVVEEFKEAALALRPNEYTRIPVESMFGYHIIENIGSVEPFREVRDRVRDELERENQQEAFQSFVNSLRAEADIKYFTDDGVVTDRRSIGGEMAGFSSCVAGSTTLYGTSWSQFTQEQLALFGGDAVMLTYVDCDEKPHLCSAANIEKYPTWVIDGERYGQLSLVELAEKTGCGLE